jgi:cytochrome c oxidase subunit IV
MRKHLRRLMWTWVVLLALLGIQFGASFLPLSPSLRLLLLVPTALMVAGVAAMFMQIGRGPALVRIFAAAGLLWLSILLGLGSVDPLTRVLYPVAASAAQ